MQRGANMQLLLSFLRTPQPPGAAPVWDAVDDEQRAEALTMLARLIAKVAAARSERGVAAVQVTHHE